MCACELYRAKLFINKSQKRPEQFLDEMMRRRERSYEKGKTFDYFTEWHNENRLHVSFNDDDDDDDDEPSLLWVFTIAPWQIHSSPSNHLQKFNSPNEKWSNDWDISTLLPQIFSETFVGTLGKICDLTPLSTMQTANSI